jgi:mutator protein MutT
LTEFRVPISPYLKMLRSHVGTSLLLTPGVAGIVRNEAGHVLFQRRSDDGEWSLPAGCIDPGETPSAACIREVREETGLHVEVVGIIGVYGGEKFRHQYPHGDLLEFVVVVFECRTIGGTLTPEDDETLELRYFPADARPKVQLPFPDEVFTTRGSSVLFNR